MIYYQVESWESYYRDSQEINKADYDEIWSHKRHMKLKPNEQFYENLEKMGKLLIVTVREDYNLIGFHITIISEHSHSADTLCAYQDACYLHKKYRGIVGWKLLKKAEEESIKRGAKMLIWTTPLSKSSERILKAMRFEETDRVFCKWVGA